jgi:hypothetical protein
MLELARRHITSDIIAKYYDDETKITRFMDLTKDDISGAGRIRPKAARHFAEAAQILQNLNSLAMSPLWEDIRPHISSIKLADAVVDLFDLEVYKMNTPYVRLAEEADAQRIAQAQEEQVLMEALTAAGISADDVSDPIEETMAVQPGGPVEQALTPPEAQGGY